MTGREGKGRGGEGRGGEGGKEKKARDGTGLETPSITPH